MEKKPESYTMQHLAGVKIGSDNFWIKKMSKLEWDGYERKYSFILNSSRMMGLLKKKAEAQAAFDEKKINRKEFLEESKAIEQEVLSMEEESRKRATYDIDGREIELFVSYYAAAEKLSLTVFVPEVDENDEPIVEKNGQIKKQLMSIGFWIYMDDTIFTKLAQIVDEFQFYGLDEPVSILEDASRLFEGDTEPIHPDEIIARLMTFKDEYASGAIHRKKSTSAYGVQITLPK